MAKHWIAGSIKRPGALTAQAKRAGETVAQFIEHPPKSASTTTKRRIALAKKLESFRHH
jgi:hypothetical protein